MAIDFNDNYEDFDDDGDLNDDEHHDDDNGDLDDDEHHDDDDLEDRDDDDDEYVPPAPRRSTNPRSLSPVLSARPRSGGLFPCGIVGCLCGAYIGIASYGNTCDSCKHLYDIHSGLTRD